MTLALTVAQLAAFKLAPSDWQPVPSEVSRQILFALRNKKLVILRAFPISWKLSQKPPSVEGINAESRGFMDCVRNARRRATLRGLEFEITNVVAQQLWARCLGRCELTDIKFDFSESAHDRRPFAPSIDRIDSGKGYTESNVRVVCVAVNLAMNQWGEDVLRKIAVGVLQKKISI